MSRLCSRRRTRSLLPRDRFELTVRDGELDWTIERQSDESDVADELTRLWGKF
ncbi:hypothetical protein C439_15189 [Haloferax mediterranei ATCC 33500]|uniref:Uncharacterized protein n=1 Tax=Haloferax mediterranei (strain ATCC 33500 / DSM 1411 / JCM 8866 / NBRC 14739 / NCIMB 2177 / R-4) TaxID=523841 RepID=I3R800_HALMT|nr:hypothetical protein [Haloferax mediterranei]AFK20360.1 hypothetical protein HFX_2682 [Haloferax mediterranei ATCC 33500]ELZ99215.1 hypothetical protein C439_15189 [Haloferax mediterranei ATCC 33500]MDX5986885.1 hypothetical protein [Haloferax mediterranei ATCC 33500]